MKDNSLTMHLGIGVDTARYAHHVSFLDEKKRTAAKPFHFTETADGYRKLRQALDRLAKKHPRLHLHIHVDAAGQYAENLLQWLHQLPFDTTISVGQPARNKAYRKVHFDKRKADPVESLACARFAIVERPLATPHNPPQFRQLRDAVAMREAAAKQQTRLINQLHGLLAQVFARQRAAGKDYNLAIGHCMAKLLRQVFGLWKKDEDFDPDFERVGKTSVDEQPAEEKAAVGHRKAVEPQGKVVTTTASKIAPVAKEDKLPPLNFGKLRERVTITQVLEHLQWHRRTTRGDQWRGCCPLHDESDAQSDAFAVETKKSLYCCHRCGSQGNVLDLWIALRGKPILAAGWDLVETFGLEPPLLGE